MLQADTPLLFNSPGHQVLQRLAELGGRADKAALISLFYGLPARQRTYLTRALDGLTIRQMASVNGDSVRILALGEGYLKKVAHRIKPKVNLVPPRTAPTFKPLAADAMTAGRPMRPGADDYRGIPSLMAGRRVVRSESC